MARFSSNRTSPSADQLAGIYDAHAATWLQRESRAETKLTTEAWRNDLIQLLHGDVLEIGVAAGDTLNRLNRYDHHVTSFTGIDLSPAMIEVAKRVGEQATFPLELQSMNAEDLSAFADASFDTVTASLVLCTIPDVPRALAEIARVLKPGGRFVAIEHVLSPNFFIGAGQKLFAPLQLKHMGCHLDRTTVDTLVDNGYEIEEHRQRLFGIMRFIVARPPR